MDNKPQNIIEYKTWLKNKYDIDLSDKTKRYYDAVVSKATDDFRNSDLWKTLISQLEQSNQEYYLMKNYYLFADTSVPELYKKSFDSFLLKTFRYNVVNNPEWPNEPDAGLIMPVNWFSRINDMVRTCFVVKYLDGVTFFASKLTDICNSLDCTSHIDYEAKEEGYYAAHFYVSFRCDVPLEDWDTKYEIILVEIQITTQLQEVIKRLLHKHYEQRRERLPAGDIKWQWDYRSDEFATNYLGHILHYIEGMIVEMRDRKPKREDSDEN